MCFKSAVNIFLIIFTMPEFACISLAQTQPNYSSEQLYNETMAVVEKVKSINNYAGNSNVDSTSVLPFGIVKEIGTTRYIIAIDSAIFLPGKAMYSAYMAVEFPGSTESIAFAGKNLAFNPKGIIPGNNTLNRVLFLLK